MECKKQNKQNITKTDHTYREPTGCCHRGWRWGGQMTEAKEIKRYGPTVNKNK